jgi:hypothetical protein
MSSFVTSLDRRLGKQGAGCATKSEVSILFIGVSSQQSRRRSLPSVPYYLKSGQAGPPMPQKQMPLFEKDFSGKNFQPSRSMTPRCNGSSTVVGEEYTFELQTSLQICNLHGKMPELHDAKKMSRNNAPLFIGLSLFFISVGLGRWRTSKTYKWANII